jgi:hypothetical protein
MNGSEVALGSNGVGARRRPDMLVGRPPSASPSGGMPGNGRL